MPSAPRPAASAPAKNTLLAVAKKGLDKLTDNVLTSVATTAGLAITTAAVVWSDRLLDAVRVPVPAHRVLLGACSGLLVGLIAMKWRDHQRVRHYLHIFVRDCNAQPGTSYDEPVTLLHMRAEVTNAGSVPLRLMRADARHGLLKMRREEGWVAVAEHPRAAHGGENYIEPGETGHVVADFILPRHAEEATISTSVVLTDHLGRTHTIRGVQFRPYRKPPQKPRPPEEPLFALMDPVDKQVAAVLKAEAKRYAECGRTIGGLGSITLWHGGTSFVGLGTEWRHADSAENQSLAFNDGELRSDNVDALVTLCKSLGADEDRGRFVQAITGRMVADSEYTPVAYLGLVALFRVGHLADALRAARDQMHADKTLGFDEFRRVLDGLLRFEYRNFDEQALDDVERFTQGLNVHMYRIAERLAAIRAHRLLAPRG